MSSLSNLSKPNATLVMTVLSAAAGLVLVGGCDRSAAAERKTKVAIQQAVLDIRAGGDKGTTSAKGELEKIANDSGSSPAAKAHASSMLAQLQYDTGIKLTYEINRKEMELSRLAFELSQLGVQLDMGALLATDYAKYDPKTAREKILQQVTDATGGNDKQVWEYEGTSMPTLSAIRQKISQLQGDIAKLQDQAKTIEEQRVATQSEADTALQAADAAKGQKSVDEFRRASGLRHKAADLYTQIDQTRAAMQPLERELAVAQGQEKVVDDVIKQLQSQAAALDAGWKAMEEKIASQKELAQKIVGSSGSASASTAANDKRVVAATVSEKVAEMGRIADEIRKLRGEAQSKLDDAAKLFNDANKSANDLKQTLSSRDNAAENANRPEREWWQKIMKVMDPPFYKLREATVYRAIGSLHSSDAISLANRAQLAAAIAPTITKAGATMTGDFGAGQFKNSTALTQANAAYERANELLTNITEGVAVEETKQSAKVERILVLYGWAQVEKMNGESGKASEHLQLAVSTRNDAATAGIRLPSLPIELGSPPAPAGETPVPATQPADGAAPTTAPADAAAAPADASATPTTEPATQPTEPPG